MGTSIERRLAKLEAKRSKAARRARPEACAVRARKAIDSGTASLEEYAIGDPDEVARAITGLLACGVVLAIRQDLGWNLPAQSHSVLAFPPDQEPPEALAVEFKTDASIARWLPGPKATVEHQGNGRPWPSFLLPSSRRGAAYSTLAMGEPDGVPLRNKLWRRVGDEWALTADAWDAADVTWMLWSEMEWLLKDACWFSEETAPAETELAIAVYALQEDGTKIVPYSEVARITSCLGTVPPEKPVPGQSRSNRVIWLLPDSCMNPSEGGGLE